MSKNFFFTYLSKKVKTFEHFLFSVKRKLCSGLEKVWGLSALLMLILLVLTWLLIVISIRLGFRIFIDSDVW